MNRRNFLKMMLSGAAVAVAGPALALAPSPKPKQQFYGKSVSSLMNGKIGRINGFDIYPSDVGDVRNEYAAEAAKQMTNKIDEDLLDSIMEMSRVLDEQNISQKARWLVMDEQMASRLMT